MNGSAPRHGNRFSKTPPFLMPGLIVVIVILSFNYWRTSRLNKELIQNVSVTQAKSQRLEHELKDAAQTLTEAKKDLNADIAKAKAERDSDKRNCEAEKAKLNDKVKKLEDEIHSLQEERAQLKIENDNVRSEIEQLKNKQAEEKGDAKALSNKNEEMTKTLTMQQRQHVVVMTYVAQELGKEGIEHLLAQSVLLPSNVTMPPANQQPLCSKRAEEICRRESSKVLQVVKQPTNLESPNIEVKRSEANVGPDANPQQLPNQGGGQLLNQPADRDQVNGGVNSAENKLPALPGLPGNAVNAEEAGAKEIKSLTPDESKNTDDQKNEKENNVDKEGGAVKTQPDKDADGKMKDQEDDDDAEEDDEDYTESKKDEEKVMENPPDEKKAKEPAANPKKPQGKNLPKFITTAVVGDESETTGITMAADPVKQ